MLVDTLNLLVVDVMLLVKGRFNVSLATKLQIDNLGSMATTAFFGVAGILLLVFMAMSGFPPHVALIGITSIIAAFGLFKKRFWATWLVVSLFFVVTSFTLYTAFFTAGIDALATAGMIIYAILTWIFTAYAVAKRPKND